MKGREGESAVKGREGDSVVDGEGESDADEDGGGRGDATGLKRKRQDSDGVSQTRKKRVTAAAAAARALAIPSLAVLEAAVEAEMAQRFGGNSRAWEVRARRALGVPQEESRDWSVGKSKRGKGVEQSAHRGGAARAMQVSCCSSFVVPF